jgi:mercuric ion binding protein
MNKLLAAAFLVLGLVSGVAHAAVQSIKAEVNGMVCAFCAQGIEKKMRALPQTRDVYVDLKNKVVAVELKEGQQLSLDTVRDAIKDAGYDVPKIEMVPLSVREIRAAARQRN